MHKLLCLGGSGLIGKEISLYANRVPSIKYKSFDFADQDFSSKSSSNWLRNRVKNFNPDTIIVLSAVKRQVADESSIYDVNQKITDNIIHGLDNYTGSIIYLSSAAVFGEKNSQINIYESSKHSPTSFYGKHKSESETKYMESFDEKSLLILRPPLIYSIQDPSGYTPGSFLYQALHDKTITLWGNGEELREFIFVGDAAKFIVDSALLHCSGVLNLVSGTSYSFYQIASQIAFYLPVTIKNKHRTQPLVHHQYVQSSRIPEIFPTPLISPMKALDHYFKKNS